MKIYRLALILGLFIVAGSVQAQSFELLENRRGDNPFLDNGFEVYLRRTQVSGKFTESFGGTTFNIKYRGEDYRKGGVRWHFENPTLGDMLFVVAYLLKGKDDKRKTDQSFGSGFFGWHQVYWNAVAQDKLLISPGISFGDYIFATQRAAGTTGVDQTILDPAGYFFHAGPSLMVTKLIGNSTWINMYTRYDLTTRAGKPSGNYLQVDGYKKPHFFALGTSIQHAKTRLCGGINYTHMIDRGGNRDAASRVDISFGYMF